MTKLEFSNKKKWMLFKIRVWWQLKVIIISLMKEWNFDSTMITFPNSFFYKYNLISFPLNNWSQLLYLYILAGILVGSFFLYMYESILLLCILWLDDIEYLRLFWLIWIARSNFRDFFLENRVRSDFESNASTRVVLKKSSPAEAGVLQLHSQYYQCCHQTILN